jgi:hypothetical protein
MVAGQAAVADIQARVCIPSRYGRDSNVPTGEGDSLALLCDASAQPCGHLQADFRTELPIPAHPDTLWEVEVKTASPVRNSPETPLSAAVEAVLEVQRFMKGLLDLQRQRG